MLSYAGVPLSPPTAELAVWAAGVPHLPSDLREFSRQGWPGGQLSQLPAPGLAGPDFTPVPGVLRWPAGASRWATCCLTATDSQLAAVRAQVYYAGAYRPAPLAYDDGLGRAVTASMYMLPPRRWTAQCDGPGVWLLTLVDARFWWPSVSAAISVTEGSTSWLSLYAAIGAALGVTISADTPDADYLTPAKAFGASYENLPALLDAAARMAGQRVAVGLDGSVHVYNVASAQATVATNLGLPNPLRAGGQLLLSNAGTNDLGALVPSNFSVVFPAVSGGAYSGAWTAEAVTLASLALPGLAGVNGSGKTQTLRALQPVAATGTQRTAWARQAATDWVRWQLLGQVSASYSGVLGWQPDSVHDLEFRHSAAGISTRVERPPWNTPEAPPVPPPAAAVFSGAKVRVGTGYSLSFGGGTASAITWDTVDFDTDGYANLAGNPNVLTAPFTAHYEVGCSLHVGVGSAAALQDAVHLILRYTDAVADHRDVAQTVFPLVGSGSNGSVMCASTVTGIMTAGTHVFRPEIWNRVAGTPALNIIADGPSGAGALDGLTRAWMRRLPG